MTERRRHVPDTDDAVLRVSRIVPRSRALGFDLRSIVWTQGCDLACPGCIVPETHDRDGGEPVEVDALADALLSDPAPAGLTLSGGEPFLQSAAAARLVARMRAARPQLSVMAFTGYRLRYLRQRRDVGTAHLLSQLDLLVDGAYIRERHAALRWRGSDNQIIHVMSPRHAPRLRAVGDTSQGIEVGIGGLGELFINGVPPVPGAREALEQLLGSLPPDDDR